MRRCLLRLTKDADGFLLTLPGWSLRGATAADCLRALALAFEAETDPLTSAENAATADAMRLVARQQQTEAVVYLRDEDGLSFAAIAERLEIHPWKAQAVYAEAVTARLAPLLKADGPYDGLSREAANVLYRLKIADRATLRLALPKLVKLAPGLRKVAPTILGELTRWSR